MNDQKRLQVMVDYLLLKVLERDWHGVSDAANDLRELEIEHPGTKDCKISYPSLT